jgi:hypothetical protein
MAEPKPATNEPSTVVIWGQDIGSSNQRCYSGGLMGLRTLVIDCVANEGSAPQLEKPGTDPSQTHQLQ